MSTSESEAAAFSATVHTQDSTQDLVADEPRTDECDDQADDGHFTKEE